MPVIDSVSTDFVALQSRDPYERSIAVYGQNLDYLLFNDVTIQFGPALGHAVGGNAEGVTITFAINPEEFKHKAFYDIRVFDNDQLIATSSTLIRVSNPLFTEYHSRKTKRFTKRTDTSTLNKRTIGLNVHWALGGTDDEQDEYTTKLNNSDTRWAREFISYQEVMGGNQAGWFDKYDRVMMAYKEQDIHVVAMLAYGSGEDVHAPPAAEDWEAFVKIVSKRYRNYVDAWEIWNEPDSPDYMHPNRFSALLPLMKVSYPVIKKNAPDSIVLNGPIADITKRKFVKRLYSYGGKYFDELSIHLYYCDEYVANGDNRQLMADLEKLYTVIPKKRQHQKIWITEFGCSLAVPGVDTTVQKRYLKQTSKELLATNRFQHILIYNLRDRPYMDAYEAQFGLVDPQWNNKPSWTWYRKLPYQ